MKLGNYATEKHKLDCLAVSIKRSCPLILIEFAGGIQTHQVGKAYHGRKKLNKMYKEVLLSCPQLTCKKRSTVFCVLFQVMKSKLYIQRTRIHY